MSALVRIPMLAEVVAFDASEPLPVGFRSTKFRYHREDPWAVVLDISNGVGWVRWHFARCLLADGLNTRTGEGDVRVFPGGRGDAHVYVELSSPTGQVVLRFTRSEIEHALDRCEDVVPEGSEHTAVDWHREWARLGEVA